LDDEVTARSAADVTLQNNIDAEETARTSADTTLQNNIDAEETRALAAEGALDGRLDTAESNITALDGRVDTAELNISTLEGEMDAVEADIVTLEAADVTLQSNIDAKQDNVITTQGDLIVGDGSGDAARLAIGTADYVLTSNGTTASWQSPTYQNKVQRKTLATSDANTGSIAALGFNNLTIGQRYRLSGQVTISQTSTAAADKNHTFLITNNGVTLLYVSTRAGATSNVITYSEKPIGINMTFTAAATTLILNVTAQSGLHIAGNNFGTNATFLELSEDNSLVDTTDWT
jgi:hypothetical protein